MVVVLSAPAGTLAADAEDLSVGKPEVAEDLWVRSEVVEEGAEGFVGFVALLCLPRVPPTAPPTTAATTMIARMTRAISPLRVRHHGKDAAVVVAGDSYFSVFTASRSGSTCRLLGAATAGVVSFNRFTS